MHKFTFRILLAFLALISTAIACNTLSDFSGGVKGARETAQVVGTNIQEGKELIGTVQSAVTRAAGSPLVGTLEAAATKVEESGAFETAKAFATERGSELLNTAQAFATQRGPAFEQTVQALSTREGPALAATIQAEITQVVPKTGEAPADIPLVEGDNEIYYLSTSLISYRTELASGDVVSFYKTQMPLNGWSLDDNRSIEVRNTAVLVFTKDQRTAVVTIGIAPNGSGTLVGIAIT